MPKEVTYIECNCEKGRLEKIAETEMERGHSGDPSDWKTTFYECDTCKIIFEKRYYREYDYYNPETNKEEDLETEEWLPYKGKLTKNEIIRFAPKHEGFFRDFDEKPIIKLRKG